MDPTSSTSVRRWTERERAALISCLMRIGRRYEVEEFLCRAYGFRGKRDQYSAPGLGGWLRLTFDGNDLCACVFVE